MNLEIYSIFCIQSHMFYYLHIRVPWWSIGLFFQLSEWNYNLPKFSTGLSQSQHSIIRPVDVVTCSNPSPMREVSFPKPHTVSSNGDVYYLSHSSIVERLAVRCRVDMGVVNAAVTNFPLTFFKSVLQQRCMSSHSERNKPCHATHHSMPFHIAQCI